MLKRGLFFNGITITRIPYFQKQGHEFLKICSVIKGLKLFSDEGFVTPTYVGPTIPPYEDKIGEPIHLKRARLLYQSRKRGMLENDLIFSSFADKYLQGMSENELTLYDRLINLPSNDWEIYYWATGVKPTPQEFDNSIMDKLKKFIKNENRENRTRQPDLRELIP